MAGTTSVPRPQFTPAGLVTPDELAIKAGAVADWNAAFGGNLNPADSTPQGQLTTSQAAIIGNANDVFLQIVNGVDPLTSSGVMQDGIGRIYFLDRLTALPTVVDVTCTGSAGTVITVNAQVRDVSGNVYLASEQGVIGAGGSVVIPFKSAVNGPINCPAGSISPVPLQIIPGWDRAANLTDGVTGRDVESRVDYEYRRRQSVALNGHGTMPSIYANVLNVDGVTDAYAIDNVKNVPVVFGTTNYELIPKSIYVAVVGGDDQAIAETIWRRKDVGADYNGNTLITVYDKDGYEQPYPAYEVQFHRPTNTPIYFTVTIANMVGLPSNAVSLVRAAIVAAFNGADGGPRARIGATIFAGRYYAAVSAAIVSVAIVSIKVGGFGTSGDSFTPGIDQYPTITENNIVVTVV